MNINPNPTYVVFKAFGGFLVSDPQMWNNPSPVLHIPVMNRTRAYEVVATGELPMSAPIHEEAKFEWTGKYIKIQECWCREYELVNATFKR